MQTLEELAATIADLQGQVAQALEVASRHAPEHADEGRDPFEQSDTQGHDHDADNVTYAVTVATDWDGDADPGNVDAALDQLAERLDDYEVLTTKGDMLGFSTVPLRIAVGTVDASILEVLPSEGSGITWVAPVGSRVYNSANISVPNAAWTALTFDSERYDTDTMHSTTSNTGRITINRDGCYSIVANAHFAANATGARGLQIKVDGSDVIAQILLPAVGGGSLGTTLNIGAHYNIVEASYVEVLAYQSSGGALNITATANQSPEFMAYRMGGRGSTPGAHTNILTLNWIE